MHQINFKVLDLTNLKIIFGKLLKLVEQTEACCVNSSGGASVLDQGGNFFSLGRQTSFSMERLYGAPL